MKRSVALVLVLMSGCVIHSRAAPPVPVVAVETFDAHLSPYGMWLVLPGYGRVWQPAVSIVGPEFYPYGTGGHWVYTDEGWVFDTDYPFGWAVFHYGRWMLEPAYGWLWIPGQHWAPSWVVWRTGGAYIGWAPLGPGGAPAFHHRHWCFVEAGQFRRHDFHRQHHAVPEGRFHEAVAITNEVHGAVGPPPAWVAAQTRTRVDPTPLRGLRSGGRVVPPPPVAVAPREPGQPQFVPPPAREEPRYVPPPGQAPEPHYVPPPGREEPRYVPPPPPPPAREEPRRVTPPPPSREEPRRITPPPLQSPTPPPAAGQPAPAPAKKQRQPIAPPAPTPPAPRKPPR